VRWDRVNFAFRDQLALWRQSSMVSDLFHVVPRSSLAAVRQALDRSGNRTQNWPGSGHFALSYLNASSVHFVQRGHYHSGQSAPSACSRPANPVFTYILRLCARSLCHPTLSACVNGSVVWGDAVPLPSRNGFELPAL
jgi:hypothetical protein